TSLKPCSVCQVAHTSTPALDTVAMCRTPPAGGFASRPSLAMTASYWSDVIPGQCMYIATAIPSPPSLGRVQGPVTPYAAVRSHATSYSPRSKDSSRASGILDLRPEERAGVVGGIEPAQI